MSGRAVLVLFAVVAVLAAFIWFYERELPSTDERQERRAQVLALQPDEVRGVTLESAAGTTRLARAEAEGWVLQEPFEARADATMVDRLVRVLADLEKERTLDDVERSEVELDPPAASIRLESTDGRQSTLLVGSRVPGSSSLVVALEDQAEVFVVADHLEDDLAREPGEWRERSLFVGERDDVRRVVLQTAGETTVLERRDDQFWITTPLEDRADQDSMDELFRQLAELDAKRFVDPPEDPGENAGLTEPAARLEVLAAEDEPSLVLTIGAPVAEQAGRRWARAGNQSVEIDAGIVELLDRPADRWVARQWPSLKVFEIDRVEVEDASGTMTLVRADADWDRDGDRVAYAPVSDFLYALIGVAAEEIVHGAAAKALRAELPEPGLTITLVSDDGPRETLELFPPMTDGSPATVSGRSTILLLPSRSVDEIGAHLEALRSVDPLPGEPSDEGLDGRSSTG